MRKGSIILAGMAALIAQGAAAETLTGCLTKGGRLVNFAVGDTPAKPCSANQQQVSIPLDGAQPPPASADAPYRFVGFSSGTTDGDAGYVGLYALCQGDYGPDARACSTKEYILSPNAAAPISNAWIIPAVVGGTNSQGSTDFSGGSGSHTCQGWTHVPGNLGLTVTAQGGITVSVACSSVLPVTCCAPAE